MNTDEILLQILEEQKKTRSYITEMRSDIKELQTGQEQMRSEINEMRSEINEMRSDIKELQTGQEQMRSEINVMHSDIEELQNNQHEMLNRQESLENRQASLENRQMSLENKVDELNMDVKSIKITLENEVSPAIKTLIEMQVQDSARLVVIEDDVRDLKDNFAINEVLFGLEKMRANQ